MSASQTIYGNSGVGTISGFVQVQPLPMQLFGGVSARVVEAYSGYDGKFGIGVFVMGQSGAASVTVNPFGYQSGTLVGISGGQLAISGVIVETSGEYFNVAASGVGISHYSGALNVNISGGTISANVSGNYVNVASSGVGISHYSGALNINISGGTITVAPFGLQSGTMVLISGGQLAISGLAVNISGIFSLSNISGGVTISGDIRNILSGTVDNFEYPSYTLISYWSGAVGKGLIGIYNSGGVAGQSGLEVSLVRLKIGIWSSGNINRVDIILGSGNVSGTAGTVVANRRADTTSMVVGYVDGATQVSGNVISTVDSIMLEANSSGYLHEYIMDYGDNKLKSIRARSGEEIWVRLISGIGIGLIALDWVERYP